MRLKKLKLYDDNNNWCGIVEYELSGGSAELHRYDVYDLTLDAWFEINLTKLNDKQIEILEKLIMDEEDIDHNYVRWCNEQDQKLQRWKDERK